MIDRIGIYDIHYSYIHRFYHYIQNLLTSSSTNLTSLGRLISHWGRNHISISSLTSPIHHTIYNSLPLYTTSTNSVTGCTYGTILSLTIVLCSNAYPIPISISSLHFSPKKLIPNGRFGAVAFKSPLRFVVTGVPSGYRPNGTVTTGLPSNAGTKAAKLVGKTTASRE